MTTPPQFNQPGQGGDKFEPATLHGKLLLVYPKKYVTGIPTKFGERDAVECDIVALDHPDPQTGQPFKLNSAMLFGDVMVGQTKSAVGSMVLGRLGQGPNTKGNPPWTLLDHTPQDAQLATSYIASHPVVSQPSGPPTGGASYAPATNDPWAVGSPGVPADPWAVGSPGVPAPAPVAPAPPAAVPVALDPQLVAFLTSKGIKTEGMNDQTARMIAATFS